ncbi:MAG: Spy/CpxP family protein refolding chaperone [Verrucomicrobiales bacterium]|jgi:Spy/CpxP family protein refolding chaperone|nr:Spy/CpxP family protein refolding chaperone [Verrucomicrobiales bacterium]
MKRIIVVALATFTISSLTVLHAQSEEAAPLPAPAKKERVDRAAQLKKQLNLTDEQSAKVKELEQWQAGERKKLGGEAGKEQRAELRKQYVEKLNAILTSEQRTELEKLHKEWGQKMKDAREKKGREHRH